MGTHGHTRRDGWSCDVLGLWRLTHAGRVVALPMRDQRLVALLLIEGRKPRSQLAGLLWPDSSEERAQGNLRSTALDLREKAPGLVESDEGTLGLTSGVDSDLYRLLETLDGSGPQRTAVEESEYLMSVRGLLPGWYDDWLTGERRRLDEVVIDRMTRVLESLIEEQHIGQALPLARAAIHREPLRESAHRSLARVHLLAGDKVAAWQVYADFRRRSITQFGVAPSHQFDELMEPLRAERRARRIEGPGADRASRRSRAHRGSGPA